ncbi:MAG: CTP synthase [Aigarchaeota archaeon]|jgi:CTP synthase|nr:CTP synthase [Candidatus Wolframiiraptor gerlachensis]
MNGSDTRFIFVTGGVLSGLGKGVVTASIGKLLQFRGYTVDAVKIDPYLNVDPGTLNPVEHGEVFVCEDVWEFEAAPGYRFRIAEIDQDFGTYERFLEMNMHPSNNITSGQVYLSVILKERVGEFLGKTIQVIPHITDEIKRRILGASQRLRPDVLLVEIGGTVGDIEVMPFLEALRQLVLEFGKGRIILVHVTLVPYLETVGQLKTKPTQHSVKLLQSMGLQPDIIVGRSRIELPEEIKEKISLFCSVPRHAVISDPDLETPYELPMIFERQGLGDLLCSLLGLPKRRPDDGAVGEWSELVRRLKEPSDRVRIAMPGKYCMISDSYISIIEALRSSAAWLGLKAEPILIETEEFERDPEKLRILDDVDGILLTPGFGARGVEGMIMAAEHAIRKQIPLLGICFGAQLLFVAFSRLILGLKNAHSTEVDPNTPHPVVDLLSEQREMILKGGTMKLGGRSVKLIAGTKLYQAYKSERIIERFRHRYHISPRYAELAAEKGLMISAYDELDGTICGIELKDAWIVGVQFHPEFKSRPRKPSPLFIEFIRASYENRRKREGIID